MIMLQGQSVTSNYIMLESLRAHRLNFRTRSGAYHASTYARRRLFSDIQTPKRLVSLSRSKA